MAAQLCSTNRFREFWHNNNNLLWVYFLYKYGNLDFSRRGWYPKLMDELKMCSKIPVGAILNVVILLVHFLWLSRLQASVIAMYSCLANQWVRIIWWMDTCDQWILDCIKHQQARSSCFAMSCLAARVTYTFHNNLRNGNCTPIEIDIGWMDGWMEHGYWIVSIKDQAVLAMTCMPGCLGYLHLLRPGSVAL